MKTENISPPMFPVGRFYAQTPDVKSISCDVLYADAIEGQLPMSLIYVTLTTTVWLFVVSVQKSLRYTISKIKQLPDRSLCNSQPIHHSYLTQSPPQALFIVFLHMYKKLLYKNTLINCKHRLQFYFKDQNY